MHDLPWTARFHIFQLRFEQIPAKNEKEIAECELKCKRLQKEKAEAEEVLQSNLLKLKDQVDPLTAEKEKLEAELVDVQVRNDTAKSELALAESELNLVQQNETNEKRKYDRYRTSLEESKEILANRKIELGELEKKIPEIKTEMVQCEQSLKQYKAEENQLHTEVVKLRAVVSELNMHWLDFISEEFDLQLTAILNLQIDEKQSAMQQTRHNNKIVEYLLRKKNSGQIPGIFGRLVSFGRNPSVRII